MIMGSGKRLISCSEEQKKKKKKQRVRPYLPDEFFIDEILIRLPARSLAICSCVSKLWYNSISQDPKFASSHVAQNKNKSKLVFNLLNAFENGLEKAYFLSIEEEETSKHADFYYHKLLANISSEARYELVGYCNGLVCLKSVSGTADGKSEIAILNPTRGEVLHFSNSTPALGCKFLCHGFGFDSSLQEYKAVFVYTNEEEEEFVCMVITLGGENSWRTIVASTASITFPPGSSPCPSRMVITASRSSRTSATLCGGDLFWRITNTKSNDYDKSDMLLSFDIHNEKIHFIRLPAECCLTHTTNDGHHRLVVDHHLMEFQGDLCVARTEKIMRSNCNDPRHKIHNNDNHYYGESFPWDRFCCCGFKVHLYIMNDKVKQEWTKGKTFDFQPKDGLLPEPFCCYFDDIPMVDPPTRMLSCSDQLLLYWFDGLYLIIYSLQMERPKIVRCFNSYDGQIQDIFDAKINSFGHDGNKFFPYMDYQLHAQVENIITMKKLIPGGLKTSTGGNVCRDADTIGETFQIEGRTQLSQFPSALPLMSVTSIFRTPSLPTAHTGSALKITAKVSWST